MEHQYLLDTSAVIKYLNGTLTDDALTFIDSLVDNKSTISFISQIELQVWKPPNEADLIIYTSFVSQSEIIGINEPIIEETIRIRKFYSLKLPDALIAATAIVKAMTLIADNDKDFKRVAALAYVNANLLPTN